MGVAREFLALTMEVPKVVVDLGPLAPGQAVGKMARLELPKKDGKISN